MNYDNVKSHKKPGFYPLFKKYIFRKTTGGTGQIDPSVVLGLQNFNFCIYTSTKKQKSTKDLVLNFQSYFMSKKPCDG